MVNVSYILGSCGLPQMWRISFHHNLGRNSSTATSHRRSRFGTSHQTGSKNLLLFLVETNGYLSPTGMQSSRPEMGHFQPNLSLPRLHPGLGGRSNQWLLHEKWLSWKTRQNGIILACSHQVVYWSGHAFWDLCEFKGTPPPARCRYRHVPEDRALWRGYEPSLSLQFPWTPRIVAGCTNTCAICQEHRPVPRHKLYTKGKTWRPEFAVLL